MKNRKFDKNFSWILLGLLVALGVCLLAFFHVNDRKKLQSALDETISFTKLKIRRYDTYRNNDQVKSLVRLLDKSVGLSKDINEFGTLQQSKLDEYADNQRLSGILVLDENLSLVMKTSKDPGSEKLWEDMVHNTYVKDIVKYPQKTYTTRVVIDGETYDFAAVSRKDTAGMIVTYVKKEELSVANGDLIFDTLFADFPFEMNGVVVVCEDDKVISSNNANLMYKSVSDCNKLFKGKFSPDSSHIVRLRSDKGTWYGKKDALENYTIYMFFPSSQVFMNRNIVCGIYILVAAMIYLLHILGKSRSEKAAMAREQKRLLIINAIGHAYSSISLVDLSTQGVEVIKSASTADESHRKDILRKDFQEEHVNRIIAKRFVKEYLDFINMDTVAQRLMDDDSLSYTCQTVDGNWIASLIVPQRYDKDGNITAVLIANRDVTAEKERDIERDKALRNALASAERANKAKTAFLNNMSHDIRTPMNAIIGFTALAVTHIDNKDHVLEYLQKISTSSKHLLSLINDVLDMSRIENGNVRIDETETHLPDVLHDLRSIIQGNIGSKQQDLYIDTQDVVHEDIIIDKLRLNQVLLNIISNAVKFTPVSGMINVRVTEKSCNKKGYATYEFSVKDNGIGIAKEFQEHIFDSFSRERSVTESGIQGTGLGLAIVKNIVDMMGGTIVINSEKGKGSEFIVTLDCKISEKVVRYEPIEELSGARALVVDDDVNTCLSVSKMLRHIKMQADWTTSGKEAVMRAKEAWNDNRSFAVYIIDWMMPDMNGIETVRRIRHVIGDDTPIIILTAYDWTDIEKEAKEAGVTAFVAKPLFMSELRNVLSKPVESRANVKNEKKQLRYAGKKILLAEDNELNREIATTILQEYGFVIDAVEDGTDAVERMVSATEDQYDLILMDIQMPRMDGYTAAREIRTLDNNKKANIPIVAMTANAFDEDRQKSFEAGMNGHIAKPIDMDTIEKTLDRIFSK